MDLFDVLTRQKQNEFWDIYTQLIEKEMPDKLEEATFVAYERFKSKYRHDLTYTEHWAFLGQEVENPTECPACGDTQTRVIYMGFGMRICNSIKCRNAVGLFSWVPLIYFDGWLFPYVGWYLKGLWDWLTFDTDED